MLSITWRQPQRGQDEPQLWNGSSHNKIHLACKALLGFLHSPNHWIVYQRQRGKAATLSLGNEDLFPFLERQHVLLFASGACQKTAAGHTLANRDNLKLKPCSWKVTEHKGHCAQFVGPLDQLSFISQTRIVLRRTELGGWGYNKI